MTTSISIRKYPRKLAPLDHYLLAAYGSTEQHLQRVVVVDPRAEEPIFLTRPRARTSTYRTRLALILPSLKYLTPGLSAEYTNIRATFWWLRDWPRSDRSAGELNPLHPPHYEIRSAN